MDQAQPWDVDQVRERVTKRVNEFLVGQRDLLDSISPDAGALLDPLADFMAGGKRLRSMFLYWGWRGGGAPDCDEVVSAAAAMELLQACALVHDDVMDRSDSRRGRASMHRQFAAQHERAGWAGSAEDFGSATAILIGDLCLSWADQLLLDSGLTPAALRRGKPVYDVMRTELMAGQYLDMLEQVRCNTEVEPALLVATYKSAKYTVERPLHLGAVMADADPAVTTALRDYGLALGRAFQLRDDLLGVFGDPTETGKPSGDDLREGKRTVLIALALQRLDESRGRELIEGLDAAEHSPQDVDRMRDLVARSGAREAVERMIADFARQSHSALTAPGLDDTVVAVLDALVDAATRRVA